MAAEVFPGTALEARLAVLKLQVSPTLSLAPWTAVEAPAATLWIGVVLSYLGVPQSAVCMDGAGRGSQ